MEWSQRRNVAMDEESDGNISRIDDLVQHEFKNGSLMNPYRIRNWRHSGENTLAAGIRHRHNGQSHCVMLWDAIGNTSRSSLVRMYGT
ncbi:hypothetical protein TNCV_3073401 [Trichonephila clavipes]|nr:hypothetical protein TNCV_3073401 [Trichonephila clavipes]